MNYLVTGATGFIGKRLVQTLLARSHKNTIYIIVRQASLNKLAALYDFWQCDDKRVIAVVGDLTQSKLGLADADLSKLKKVDHFFHAAAVYDLSASEEDQIAANIDGTRHAVQLANQLKVGCFQHISSIAAAGMFEGVFREDMFEEAENLDHAYYLTKHESEKIVRQECKTPWRVYRPGSVVGDSKTGDMDKIDGPYYIFKLIQKLRKMLPPWMPFIGIEGGRINIVPVDFVVAAIDHIAHIKGQDGKAFHIVDPEPHRVGDVVSIFAKAAHAPQLPIKINAALFGFIPKSIKKGMMSLTPVRRIRDAIMRDLGLPEDIFLFINYPTRFDCRETDALLRGTGITCPRLDDYAWKLWDYWERHLDPDLQIDRTLKGRVQGKVVLITGGSSGIGLATAHKVAEAGAITIIVGRDEDKLKEAQAAIQQQYADAQLITFSADIAKMEECDRLTQWLKETYGGVDILINNAGRSIRRGVENSYDRFHDFERTMQLNYFGALRLTLGVLPAMAEKRKGHVINISSIGVLTNAPRFSAYVASKAALDAFTRCAASEYADVGIKFTTINMPLVRTPMIAPTKIYNNVPTLSTDQAANLLSEAIVYQPVRIATRLGIFGQVMHAIAPRIAQIIMNTSFRMFPDSDAAKVGKEGHKSAPKLSADQMALQQILRGIHF
jgi:NAD(P)-dependent dehydrogenase (short-subunit alcohol dehydrogenase family)